jgi:hypothetical protein
MFLNIIAVHNAGGWQQAQGLGWQLSSTKSATASSTATAAHTSASFRALQELRGHQERSRHPPGAAQSHHQLHDCCQGVQPRVVGRMPPKKKEQEKEETLTRIAIVSSDK